MLVTGGDSESGVTTSAQVYDPAGNGWTPAPDMATARWYPTVVELGSGNLFTVGGLDATGRRTNTSQRFAAKTNTWSGSGIEIAFA